MSIERTINDLERHLDYATIYFADAKSELADLENEYINEIAQLKDDISTLEAQNELLKEQLDDLKKENAMFQLELAEITIHYLHYKGENEVFKSKLIHMQRELDLSRKRI